MAIEIESVESVADTHKSVEGLPGSPLESECFSYESSPPKENPLPAETKESSKSSRGRGRSSILARSSREDIAGKILIGSRAMGFLFTLISLSVLSADRSKGWALDSFYRYREFRYSLSVNVIGCLYSALHLAGQIYTLAMRKGVSRNRHGWRYMADFCLDQIMAYLLISASSSGTCRVEDWELNWGKDEFTKIAKASLAFSYLAFLSFALTSLLSGYALVSRNSF